MSQGSHECSGGEAQPPSSLTANPTVTDAPVERKRRPTLPGLVILHLGVASIAYETQGRFYSRLHSPANLGLGLVDIALQPTTFAITATITAVVTAAYLVSRRLRISWVVVSLTALVASVTMTAAALGADADTKATTVESGRPTCSGTFTPYRLCAQRVFVTGVPGVDMSWLPGGQALYLGDSGRRYLLVDPALHKTFSVSQQDVALAFPLS